MSRLLFDTSVYGKLLEDKEFKNYVARYTPYPLMICGSEIIRKELRNISKEAKFEGRSKQILLLELYDMLVRRDKHTFRLTPLVELIADKYYEEYKKAGGNLSKSSIINDFLIIASATIHSTDLVISADENTMLGENAVAAYKIANQNLQLTTPRLIPYKIFKEKFRRFLNGDYQ